MTNKQKKKLLKTAKILISQCTEYTPPQVRSSFINYNVAKCLLHVDALINVLNE